MDGRARAAQPGRRHVRRRRTHLGGGTGLVGVAARPADRRAVRRADRADRVPARPGAGALGAELGPAAGRRRARGCARPGQWRRRLDSALDSGARRASAQVADARGRAQVLLVGLLVTAILTLVLAALLLARRRAGPLTLARERGATLVGIGAELAVESLLVAVAGAAVGLAVTAALVGSVGWRWVLPVVAVAALAAPVLGTLEAGRATSARRVPANRAARRTAERRRRTRRLVLEAAVVGLAVVTFVALQQRGPVEGDLAPVSTPTVWALVGALVLVRVLPPQVRLGGAEGRSLGWPAVVLRGGPGCRRRAARAAAGRRGGRRGPARARHRACRDPAARPGGRRVARRRR